ncbi:M42 family metallopeptidase [Xylanivirga thermophila]|uniref:M42 family metallopeptidase n=1 Tax=Xylanivirga thermophila TaxID=2496273 RepID=UPI00101D1CE7|nr:M42 family metallopeptidase [Xylanivirga thermophila]
MKELLKKLVTTYGPSGNEDKIRTVIADEIRDYVDKITVDVMGNLIAHKKGNGPRIMLAAHMDQIGLMVTYIDENGFLRFSSVGGVSVVNTIHSKVIFKNGLVGVVSYENEISDIKKVNLNKMYIDIGASNREEAESMVAIGDMAVYYTPFAEAGNNFTCGAMDNRSGCAVLIETIKHLKNCANDAYFVFTVQEEVGLRGARTSAFAIEPDIAIAVDVTGTGDTPKSMPMAVKLGSGPAIKVKDGSVIVHPKVKTLMVDTAKGMNMPYQMEILEYGGTDSGAISLSREGVPSGVLSIPCRYVHSASEMVSKSDMENGIKLLTAILEKQIEL